MATPEDLLASAQAAGAQVRRKPAWQQLRERGIGGQGSAAANKATLTAQATPQPPTEISPGENRSYTPPAGEILRAQPITAAPIDPTRASRSGPAPAGDVGFGEWGRRAVAVNANGAPSGAEGIMAAAVEARKAAGPNFQEDPGYSGLAQPPAATGGRTVSELPMPFRSLRVGGTPTVAPPPPDTAPEDGRDKGIMALRALRLKPFETGGGTGSGGVQSVAPETPQGPPGGGSGRVGRPIGGNPPPFATEDTPPWAGLASLMAKPRFQPSGDLQQGAPDEPPQGAPGNETPPWLAGLGPFKARRPLGGLGGFGGGQSRVEPKEDSAY